MRKLRSIHGAMATAALAFVATPALAQDAGDDQQDRIIESQEVDLVAIADGLQERDYHPDEYRPYLLAAEALFVEEGEDLTSGHPASICPQMPSDLSSAQPDPVLDRYAAIAFDVVALEQRLIERGFDPAVVDKVLATFERDRLTIAQGLGEGTLDPARATPLESEAWQRFIQTIFQSDADLAAQMNIEGCMDLTLSSEPAPAAAPAPPPDPEAAEAARREEMAREARRARAERRRAQARQRGRGPAGTRRGAPRGAIISVEDGPASVFMISRFRFQVCRAREIDPWDIEECPWNEIETDRVQQLSGRFRYQIRWTDGTERRGMRVIDNGTHTFRKDGS